LLCCKKRAEETALKKLSKTEEGGMEMEKRQSKSVGSKETEVKE
jgi:hypothetical protein